MNKTSSTFRCGQAALVGRPNVGKSTLLNHLLGQKLSITSRKPQTTRHQILGIKTTETAQIIYVDTPGMHRQQKRAMNRYMNRVASSAIEGVSVVVFLIEALKWTDEDQMVLKRLQDSEVEVILAVNKVDRIDDKESLLPFLQKISAMHNFKHVVPLSALKGNNLETLESLIVEMLDQSEPWFPKDQITDRSVRFLTAEIVREKLMRGLGQELPYDLTVEIEQFREEQNKVHINALIWVERTNQKSIVIGKGGERLKAIGQRSRKDIENMLQRKVFLEIWVKVKEGWSDDERALLSLGYHDEFK